MEPPAVVGFGMLTPVAILVVDELPEHNTGALISEISEFVFDDAAIVACLLRQWGIPTGIIGTTLGDDPRGRALADQLEAWGVQGEVRMSKDVTTPLEVDVSDQSGARTYFWKRDPRVLATLDSADLTLLEQARLLYVDWYDGDHILRAMAEAARLEIPVFLNIEHAHSDPELVRRYARPAHFVQAVTDAAQESDQDPLEVAATLRQAGVNTALLTLAGEGCLVVREDKILRVHAPKVPVVDGCGAGATFSAGFVYGWLNEWPLDRAVRFATAAASLKVTRPGLTMWPVEEIEDLASGLEMEVSTSFAGKPFGEP